MKKYLRYFLSVSIAGVFLWLAFRNVSFGEVRLVMSTLTWYWVIPYLFISLFSHYLRAERWKLFIEQEGVRTNRLTLFTGVMLGYMVNYAVPRLGELSRSVYVGNKEGLSRSRLVGTVVLERGLDLLVLLVLVLVVFYYILSDISVIAPIVGSETILFLTWVLSMDGVLFFFLFLVFFLLALTGLYYMVVLLGRWLPFFSHLFDLIADISKKFFQGLLSISRIKNWPLFLLLTAGIWFCYVIMTYIPFVAFNLHVMFDLGFREAFIITVISAMGIALPSPGGIGTYHWLVSRSLFLLFAVPEAVGAAYSIVSHLVPMIIILVITPLLLMIEQSGMFPGNKKQPQQHNLMV